MDNGFALAVMVMVFLETELSRLRSVDWGIGEDASVESWTRCNLSQNTGKGKSSKSYVNRVNLCGLARMNNANVASSSEDSAKDDKSCSTDWEVGSFERIDHTT
jgi:hypothetical protein